MKILSLLNLIGKLTRTSRLFVRARNYGVNPLTTIKAIYVVRDKHDGNDLDNYGAYRYATDMDKDKELGFELIFEDKRNGRTD
jgi:hypothetical protein